MIITLIATAALAVSPQERGLEIARAADAADSGWLTEVVSATLTIAQPSGKSRQRGFRLTLVEAPEERSLIEILQPARQRGLKVLTVTAADGAETVWVHFPRHARTSRIVGRKRTGRFLGSELTYEDLGSRKSKHYTHRWLRDEACGKATCHVVETRPKDPDTGYSRIVLWRQTGSYRLVKVAWFGRDGDSLVKEGAFSGFEKHGRYERPNTYVIKNAQSGRQTTLSFKNRALGVTLPDGAVSKQALSR